MKNGIEHRGRGSVRSAQDNDNSLCHTNYQSSPHQIGRTTLEGGSNIIHTHIIELKDHSDNTGYQTHHKELGGNLRNVEALFHHAPYGPDHSSQNHK